MRQYWIITCLCVSLYSGAALASNNLSSVQEQQAHTLFRELRCITCDGQSLAESDAPLAIQLRSYIKKQFLAGHTEQEIKKKLVASYGEQILLKPRWSLQNYPLWLLPFIMALISVAWVKGLAKKNVTHGKKTTE